MPHILSSKETKREEAHARIDVRSGVMVRFEDYILYSYALWVLPIEKTQELFERGHGTAPCFIYARGISNIPSLDQTTFDKKKCTLILLEIGFRRDFGCDNKIAEKTEK